MPQRGFRLCGVGGVHSESGVNAPYHVKRHILQFRALLQLHHGVPRLITATACGMRLCQHRLKDS
jgi:hypothetical protein